MVKRLHTTKKAIKLILLGIVLFFVWGAIWLQSSVHSLSFAKPWILSSVNQPNAPYTLGFDDITIDWRHITELGKLHISNITLTNQEGQIFAQFADIGATIDFLNLFTGRTLLNTVYLSDAKINITRNPDKELFIGIEGAETTMALKDLAATFATSKKDETASAKIRLPFKRLRLDNAKLVFHDGILEKEIVGEPVQFNIDRKHGNYTAKLVMPYSYGDDGKGLLNVEIKPDAGQNDYIMETVLAQFPSEFVCSFAPCPEKMGLKGKISGAMRVGLMADGSIVNATAKLGTHKIAFTSPDMFAKPINLTNSEVTLGYDAQTKTFELLDSRLGLDDADATATVKAVQKPDGWYVDAFGKTTSPMEVTEIYKYWPIIMAPETRAWITSKLKGGKVESGSAHLMLTPEDFGNEPLSDKALVADLITKNITLDYLPGFPNLHHMDGNVHFTGRTVNIDGQNGTLLSGTQITKANLWCPNLIDPKIPMEATLQATSSASDAVEFLSMKYFTFDDALTLNKTATGTGVLNMKLKFDAFSNSKGTNPDELHFESVDYDIAATITNFAQTGFAVGYKVQALNGDLKANTKGMSFNGSLALGESGINEVSLNQAQGNPLQVSVKSRAPAAGKPGNDFSVIYKGGAIPDITLKGKQLDATVSYESKDNTLLSDFPSLKLAVDLDELYMTPTMPLTSVSGVLNCGQRCDVLKIRARAGKGQIAGNIINDGGVRQLVITSNDAGAFLNALGVTDRMMRGKLELRGRYNDGKYPASFDGKLAVNDFTLKNSQILGRIFSIGSLTGLSNLLTGSGIAFDKLTANLKTNKGIITIEEGRANGTAMGMTVAGTLNTTNTKLMMKGVVVPAYALNSAVGKIPIIGGFLTGGDGGGLIAFNYSVKGSYNDPDVMVNPLSGLTPGFLRGIFGIFDEPNPDAQKKD